MNNTADARDIIVPAMEKAGWIEEDQVLIFGHYHGDHTGGGRQKISGAKAVQHWADWELYLRPYQQRAAQAAAGGWRQQCRCGRTGWRRRWSWCRGGQ
jgi:glyoxylase-like metal-dependent hydrolase (beta-lactamase superfamily II)